MNQLVKVHMLPTNGRNYSIIKKNTGVLFIQTKDESMSGEKNNLYFTSDEKINPKVDWMYHVDPVGDKHIIAPNTWEPNLKFASKIVATTNKSLNTLISGGGEGNAGIWEMMPQISKKDQEAYVKAGGFDEVMLEYETSIEP